MERSRAFRRSCERKAKKKAKYIWDNGSNDGRRIGKMANCHNRPCSCEICGNPRKYFNERTIREKRSDLDMDDE